MGLEGWSRVPVGHGAQFDLDGAPLWVRMLHRTPFVDRFTYPWLVHHGRGVLTPHPGEAPPAEVIGRGWRIEPPASF